MKVDLTFHDLTLVEALQLLQGGPADTRIAAAPSQPYPSPAPSQPGPPVAAAAPAGIPGPGAVAAQPAPAAPAAGGITMEMLKKQFSDFVGKHKASAAVPILAEFGAKKCGEIPPDKWAAAYARFSV